MVGLFTDLLNTNSSLQVRDILLRVKNDDNSILQRIVVKKDPYFKKLYGLYEQMAALGYTQDFHGEVALRLSSVVSTCRLPKNSVFS